MFPYNREGKKGAPESARQRRKAFNQITICLPSLYYMVIITLKKENQSWILIAYVFLYSHIFFRFRWDLALSTGEASLSIKTVKRREANLQSSNVHLLSNTELLAYQPEFWHTVQHHAVKL